MKFYDIESGPSIEDIGLYTCYQSSPEMGLDLYFNLIERVTKKHFTIKVERILGITPIDRNSKDGTCRFEVELRGNDGDLHKKTVIYNPFDKKGLMCFV